MLIPGRFWFWVTAAVLVAGACGPGSITDAVDSGELRDLTGGDELAGAFNADAGVPRLILLLSPT